MISSTQEPFIVPQLYLHHFQALLEEHQLLYHMFTDADHTYELIICRNNQTLRQALPSATRKILPSEIPNSSQDYGSEIIDIPTPILPDIQPPINPDHV